MKKLLRSYATFTRTERLGLICLCGLLLILIVVKATMHLWVHPEMDTERQKQLVAKWEAYKHSQLANTDDVTTAAPVKEFQDAGDPSATPLPDTININTADSATLIRLKSIGPFTAHNILVRRRKKGPFTDIRQLTEVGSFTESTLQVLKKHIVFK